jgi:pSer/pThr/pTyr-binding forkhead associated (FHA) protein
MVQLEILSGKTAGTKWSARRFPVRIGRAAQSDLQIEEHGVWDDHFELSLNPAEGFIAEVQSHALMLVNGGQTERAVLKNGDLIELGGAKLRFWLTEAPQRNLMLREGFFWTVLVLVSLGQVALIYWLMQF